MAGRGVLVLAIVTAAVVLAAALVHTSVERPGEEPAGAYLPALLDRSNDVARVVVRDAGGVTTIVRTDDGWVISEKDDYPAALDRVRALILGLARLQRVEGKTSKPALYGKLGLEDVDAPGSASTLVVLTDAAANTLAAVVIGDESASQAGGPRRRFYVRAPDGDPRAWLVEGQMPDLDRSEAWMDPTLFGEKDLEIKSVTVSRNGANWTVSRPDAETEVFELEDLGPEEEIDSQYAVNQVARSFQDLTFEDVRRRTEDGVLWTAGESVVAESFDGVRLSLALGREDGRHFGRLAAEYVPPGEPDEALQSLVEAWNGLWRDREYLLPDYQAEAIVKPRDELVKSPSVEAAAEQ